MFEMCILWYDTDHFNYELKSKRHAEGHVMGVEQDLYQSATALIEKRYPAGWGGAAALRLASGDILTRVVPDTDLDALSVCMELGSLLEAHKRDETVTHSICIYRNDETSKFCVLSPCGICQERLRFWGPDILVGVTNPVHEVVFKPLRVLQPYHWSAAYT